MTTQSPSPQAALEAAFEEFRIADMVSYRRIEDPNTLLGKDGWLTRTKCALWFGPAGGGKSSLRTYAAASWALGKSWFGITPTKPLKVLIVQAENDLGDESEMLLGAAQMLGVAPEEFDGRIIFVSVTGSSGAAFCALLDKLLDHHKPDLVFVDPLFSFAGEDLSLQRNATEFLRTFLDPVLKRHSVACIMLHHTGKPPRGKTDRDALDHSSTYFGSIELEAFPRAVMCLQKLEDGYFKLTALKRGKRAGMLDPEGNVVEAVYLQHSQVGIGWEQVHGPVEGESGVAAGRKDRLEEYVDNRIRYAPQSRELEAPSRDKIMEKMGLSKRMVQMYEARFKELSKKVKKFPFN
jgi:hypothetical protein